MQNEGIVAALFSAENHTIQPKKAKPLRPASALGCAAGRRAALHWPPCLATLGAAPGYVGYRALGALKLKVKRRLFSHVLSHRLTNRSVIKAGITHRPFNWQLQYRATMISSSTLKYMYSSYGINIEVLLGTGGPQIVQILCSKGIVLLRIHTKWGLVLNT